MNQAIILAAGVGSRLQPITNVKPKCLVEVNGQALLGRMLDHLLAESINEIVIVCGYKADLIKKYCNENYPDNNFVFLINEDYDTTNNMYSLLLAKEYFLQGSFLMNADIVFDSSILKTLREVSGSAVAVDVGNFIEESMKVIVKDNTISSISKKVAESESYGCSIDLYKFTPADAKKIITRAETIITEQDTNQWTEVALDELFNEGEIKALPVSIGKARWFEIDNLDDLVTAEVLFNDFIPKLKKTKAFFVDNDGTLSVGGELLTEAKSFIERFPADKKLFILTNNSAKTEDDVYTVFKKQNVDTNNLNILISTEPAAIFLKKKNVTRLYWLANSKVGNWLQNQGFIFDEVDPEAVLLCYDDSINFEKIEKFSSFVRNNVPYYATHTDLVCPIAGGYLPDIGCYIEMFEHATSKKPILTFGKPNENFVLPTIEREKITKSEAVVVGDRVYTDIALAKNAGMISVLVLTGEMKREDYEFSDVKADIVVRNLSDLVF